MLAKNKLDILFPQGYLVCIPHQVVKNIALLVSTQVVSSYDLNFDVETIIEHLIFSQCCILPGPGLYLI